MCILYRDHISYRIIRIRDSTYELRFINAILISKIIEHYVL